MLDFGKSRDIKKEEEMSENYFNFLHNIKHFVAKILFGSSEVGHFV